MKAPETAVDLKLGVLMIFAEAQAWAHGLRESDEEASASAGWWSRRTKRAPKPTPDQTRAQTRARIRAVQDAAVEKLIAEKAAKAAERAAA